MKQVRGLMLIITFIFIIGAFAQANEIKIQEQQKISFVKATNSINTFSPLKDKVTEYKWSKDKKVKFFKNMGIAGIIVTASSGTLMLIGIILLAVNAYQISQVPYVAYLGWSAYTAFTPLGVAGGLLFGLGLSGLLIGVALIVVGFVLSNYFKKKAAMYIPREPEKAYMTTGISIKLF